MNHPPYDPFRSMSFYGDTCFLTGKKIADRKENKVHALPEWLIDRYDLDIAGITMLNGNRMKYRDMLLPASEEVIKAIEKMDEITRIAFEQGHDAVIKLPELTLFQWMARVFYGVLYQDFLYAIGLHGKKGETFPVSGYMKKKLSNLLFMMHSLIRPVQFINFSPWSIKCYRVNISKDVLNYKDETHHLNFCLGMNGFGIVACLQDNGEVEKYNHDIVEKIGNTMLHPAQFEELYGRFMYANYLRRDVSDYVLNEEGDTLVFSLPDDPRKELPRFGEWQDKTFAQVLANLWQPWGIPIEKIYSFPNSPISYLINENTNEFIRPEQVDLPF